MNMFSLQICIFTTINNKKHHRSCLSTDIIGTFTNCYSAYQTRYWFIIKTIYNPTHEINYVLLHFIFLIITILFCTCANSNSMSKIIYLVATKSIYTVEYLRGVQGYYTSSRTRYRSNFRVEQDLLYIKKNDY